MINYFNDKNVKCVDIIFLDKSDAFGRILHGKVIDELREVGIFGTFLSLISSSLENRKQYVIYNSVKSDLLDVNSGTPQGGVLSPTLFNIYTRDLPKVCKHSKPFQYADVIAIGKAIKEELDMGLLQTDLNAISQYSLKVQQYSKVTKNLC